jgi:aryl-alcohol dehydrogenase-like predicted oxidoreductase
MDERTVDRRTFLKGAAAAAGLASALGPGAVFAAEETIPRRKLGKTGLEVSLFGLGGYYLGRMDDDAAARNVVARAYDLGVNYFDTAPSYKRGRSESRIGAALKGKRDRVVLATKSTQKTAASVMAELEASLKRFGTDHVDLLQMHSLSDRSDVDRRFARDAAIAGFERAKKEGKARFIGVTGHVDPGVMSTALDRYPFDTILLPLNPADPHYLSFEKGTLPKAIEKGVGVIGMKVLAAGNLVGKGKLPASECLHYVGTLRVSTMILGCDSIAQVDENAAALRGFTRVDGTAMIKIRASAKRFKGRETEWYKRTT